MRLTGSWGGPVSLHPHTVSERARDEESGGDTATSLRLSAELIPNGPSSSHLPSDPSCLMGQTLRTVAMFHLSLHSIRLAGAALRMLLTWLQIMTSHPRKE